MLFGMGQGPRYKLVTLSRIPIYAEPSFFILMVIILLAYASGGAAGALWALVFLMVAIPSLVLHELGHAVAVRRLGYGQSEIILHGLGGVTRWSGRASRRDRIIIALAGPAVNFVLGGIGFLLLTILGRPNELFSSALLWSLTWVNLGWALFNLLPIWPMDGGHVMRYALASPSRPPTQSTKLSLTISMVTAGLVVILAFTWGWLYVAILLGFILFANYQEYRRLQGPPPSIYGY